MTDHFRGYRRTTPAPLAGATTSPQGRLRLELQLQPTITEHVLKGAQVQSIDRPVSAVTRTVDLYGPGDVAGLAPGAIVRSSPPDGAADVDGEFCAFVEFAAADLPWRYSPSRTAGDATKPWLALVAGVENRELGLDPDETLWLSAALAGALDPAPAATWAHVHTDAANRETSRLLCPRTLPAGSQILAAVVTLIDGSGEPRWRSGRGARGVPVLHHFRFTTNDAGTFEDLVAALKPVEPPAGLGAVTVHADPGGIGPDQAPALGALAPRNAPAPAPYADPTIPGRVQALIEPPPEPDEQGRPAPVLGAPDYARPFAWDPDAPWVEQVNLDPRHRAAAGLGTRAAIEWQDRIADVAAERLGQTHYAAALLRSLTAGVDLATRAAGREPADPAARLAFRGPALGGVLVDGGGDALSRLCPPERPLPPALLSSAVAHLLRAGGPTAKASGEPEVLADPGQVVAAALECPEPPSAPVEAADLSGMGFDLERALHALADVGEEADIEELRELGDGWPGEREVEEEPWCREPAPGWLDDTVAALDEAFRPDGAPVRRVTDRISGLHEPYDVPLEVRPDLDLPLWDWLRTRAPSWLLPRAGLIPRDRIVALRTNREFIAALLVGASRQAVAELRWRSVPVSAGAMPMRTFWQHVESPGFQPPLVDLVQPSSWPGVGLGQLPGPRGDTDFLVIALRSDLVRRYPDTEVYLARPRTGQRDEADLDDPIEPIFAGRVAPDVWFFGFPEPPSALAERFLVLEEPVRGPRFFPYSVRAGSTYTVIVKDYEPDGDMHEVPHTGLADGGTYASKAFARPIRAVCDGRRLLDPGEVP